ncbi:hypothetical protein OHA04_45230 (plasmid) [Streptomyces sp. NBC_01590]|uniref:hypothetical protein n=1 Tax=Streptomyces sp. NBC_01590 TaxID=2975887 RepID=UPI002F91B40F
MHIRFDPDEWRPSEPGSYRKQSTERLQPETLIVWQRQPYRVIEVRELQHANWPEKYREAWTNHGMPDPDAWNYRPRVIVVRHEEQSQTKPLHMVGPSSATWHVLPEHYAICRLCRELPPCRHVHNEAIMDRVSSHMAEQMAILPGACHACREPITKRQKAFTFPGTNLIRPDLGDDSAVFHLRGTCAGPRTSYDKRWAAAEPGRSRLFFCEGTLVTHHDGSKECDNTDCIAKGGHAEFVDHRMKVWHHPGDLAPSASLTDMVVPHCWCLSFVV